MNELLRRLTYYFRRRRFEEELDEEMRHHAELPGTKQFGNITRWKEEGRAMRDGSISNPFRWDSIARMC